MDSATFSNGHKKCEEPEETCFWRERSILVSPILPSFFSFLSKCPHFDHLKSKQATFMPLTCVCSFIFVVLRVCALFFFFFVCAEQTLAAIPT